MVFILKKTFLYQLDFIDVVKKDFLTSINNRYYV